MEYDADRIVHTFCWIASSFTMPGLGAEITGLGNDYEKEKTYHNYYQWVPFVLFFQVIYELKITRSFQFIF